MNGPDGQAFVGYSGAGHTLAEGRDNPQMVGVVGKGPIPPGKYSIGEPTRPLRVRLDAPDT